jgi:hypothetical protein
MVKKSTPAFVDLEGSLSFLDELVFVLNYVPALILFEDPV